MDAVGELWYCSKWQCSRVAEDTVRCGVVGVSMSCMKKHFCNGDWRLGLLFPMDLLSTPPPQGLSVFVPRPLSIMSS